MLIALAYMTDAILELKTDDLDTIYHCDEPQLKTLSNIVSIKPKIKLDIPFMVLFSCQ
jgi:hypothetical protein